MIITLKLKELVLALLNESDMTLPNDAVEAIVDKVDTGERSLFWYIVFESIFYLYEVMNYQSSFYRQSWKQI